MPLSSSASTAAMLLELMAFMILLACSLESLRPAGLPREVLESALPVNFDGVVRTFLGAVFGVAAFSGAGCSILTLTPPPLATSILRVLMPLSYGIFPRFGLSVLENNLSFVDFVLIAAFVKTDLHSGLSGILAVTGNAKAQ